jgi:HlyD family secretion protein
MVPTADRQKATVLVRIAFNELDPRILPDMGVKVTFLRDKDKEDGPAVAVRPVALVPKTAIRTEAQQSFVFIVVDGRVDRRAITTGGTDGDRVEVIAGLNAGERVVLSPPAELKAGALVVTN